MANGMESDHLMHVIKQISSVYLLYAVMKAYSIHTYSKSSAPHVSNHHDHGMGYVHQTLMRLIDAYMRPVKSLVQNHGW